MPNSEQIDRKKISEELLADRLGLNDDWIDRWEEDGEWREESCAPDQLPEFIRKGHNKKEEIEDIENHIERLVAAGCSRRVVYFCVSQLSADAEWLRAGGDRKSIPDRRAGIADNQPKDNTLQKRQQKLVTREDMEAVVNNAKTTRQLIQRHQRELLLVVDAAEHSLPRGLTTRLELAEDALALLEDSLTWLAKLAEASYRDT